MRKDRGAVAWAEPPDGNRGVYYPILSPKPGSEVVVIVLSETIRGVYTHWIDKQTRPCLGSPSACVGCDLKFEKRWKGYLAVWQHTKGRLALAEITREAYTRCPAFELYRGQLRGKVLRLTRNGYARNSRVTAHLSQMQGAISAMPPAFNVESALERIWFGDPTKTEEQRDQEEQPPAEQDSRPWHVADFYRPEEVYDADRP